jgi:hypothetical protein
MVMTEELYIMAQFMRHSTNHLHNFEKKNGKHLNLHSKDIHGKTPFE